MVERGLVRSRARAQDMIRRGAVTVDGRVADKPSLEIGQEALIGLPDTPDVTMVSRGALKLAAALDRFGFDPSGRIALDIGASTGGFTQVLLDRGARRVYAVDVGRDQLDPSLAADLRVVRLEATDARALDDRLVPLRPAAIVADVSFISLEKALPAALGLAAPGAWLAALVKPQFEVGRAGVGRGGIVRDAALRDVAVKRIAAWIGSRGGWRVLGTMPSPIVGGSGNVEYLLGAERGSDGDD